MTAGTGEDEPPRHVVVFDCNIYLDIASLLGAPFTWDKFNTAAARFARDPLPHPHGPNRDSLRAVASCTSGRFAGDEALEVWTNAHIDKMVRGKAGQPTQPDDSGRQGLGWSSDDASALVDDLVWGLAARASGGTLGHQHYPEGNPPLDHEDAMVFGACHVLAREDPLANVYCVTRDKGFLKASSNGELASHTLVLTPTQFVGLLRQARHSFSMRGVRPRVE
ncbi:hypothetical protein ABZ639_30185 [Saccharomonospora sp. NPDC006951]